MSYGLSIVPGKCIRCGACVTQAPELFEIEARGPARAVRPPATPRELRQARAAQLNCPTDAIDVEVHVDEQMHDARA
jgi:ferredoxin